MWLKFLEWVQWVVLATWVGSMVFVSVVGAPVAFHALADPQSAGALVGQMLDRFYLMSYILGPLLFVITAVGGLMGQVRALRLGLIMFVIFIVLGLNIYAREVVSSRMDSLRLGMGVIQAMPAQDDRRIAFDGLHRRSIELMAGSLIGGLTLIYLVLGVNYEPAEVKRWFL